MPRIDCYLTMSSPWAYLGHGVLGEIAARHGVTVSYYPLAFGRLFPETGGLPLPQRHPARQRYRLVELQRWREARGLPLRLAPAKWPFAPELADRCVVAIAETGGDPAVFMARAFAAIWNEERDLADRATLKEIATAVGFDGAALLDRAEAAGSAAVYDTNLQRALAAGVFGAPSYVRDGEVFWGQDRLALLDAALGSGRAPYLPG